MTAHSSSVLLPMRRMSGWITAAKLLALFFLILGAKFCIIRACSNPLPFFDQWDGEGRNLLQPWLYGHLRWTDLVAFHVQHRIALTRLLVLGLFQANGGQWDTQVEMIAAAPIHAACAVLLGTILIRRLGTAVENKLIFTLALLFMLPFGWENTLSGGFQSQFYFLLLLSITAIWGLGSHPPGTFPWWTGVAAAVVSWFSMASAPLAPLAVAVGIGLRIVRFGGEPPRPADARADRATLGMALGLFAAGVCVNIGVDPSANLHPKTLADFLAKFLGLLGWPNPTPWAAPLACAPWLFLAGRQFFRPRNPAGTANSLLLPLGLFVVLQTAAIAFGRNQYHGLLVSRYMDVFSIGAVVNAACLLQFSLEMRTPRERAWLAATGAGWFALLCFGLAGLTFGNLDRNLPFIQTRNADEVRNVAAFVEHPDPAHLAGMHSGDFQCDKPELLVDLLTDPRVRAALPARARLPLALTPVRAAGAVRPIVEDRPAAAGTPPMPVGWELEPPPAGMPASVFRSQTITHSLPYLELAVNGELGPAVRFGLVVERTGKTIWVLPADDFVAGEWWAAQVRAPSEPFHFEAAVAASAASGLKFFCPRETGWLSVWVEPVLDSAIGLLFAGVALWLAAQLVEKVFRGGGPGARVPVNFPGQTMIPFDRQEISVAAPALNGAPG